MLTDNFIVVNEEMDVEFLCTFVYVEIVTYQVEYQGHILMFELWYKSVSPSINSV